MKKYVTKAINVTATSGGSSGNVLYTCPSRFNAMIFFLHIASRTTNNEGITIQWFDASASTYFFILNGFLMANNNAHEVGGSGAHIVLQPGDKIVCSTSSAANFDVSMSVEEVFRTQND